MPRIATEADFNLALATIVAAFHEDPLWSWMFPDPHERTKQHATVFGLYVEGALPRDGVWLSNGRASAVAVFTPPGESELSEQVEARLDAFIRETLGDHAPAVLETLDRFHAAIPDGPPFYYLSFLEPIRRSAAGASVWACWPSSRPRPTAKADPSIWSPPIRPTLPGTSVSAFTDRRSSRHPTECTPSRPCGGSRTPGIPRSGRSTSLPRG